MCTVIVEVPEQPASAVRLLAVRDEDPGRAWDPPGEWWPEERPGIIGVRDRRANGAWLAAAPKAGRLAVILNRAATTGAGHPEGGSPRASRGQLVLDDVAGLELPDPPLTSNFNLVSVSGSRVSVATWNGSRLHRTELSPGLHMIAHHEVDDPGTERIAAWLPRFRELAGASPETWQQQWIALLDRTTTLDPTDERAIIRDNRPHGYPTLSLVACIAEITEASVTLGTAEMHTPGQWNHSTFELFGL